MWQVTFRVGRGVHSRSSRDEGAQEIWLCEIVGCSSPATDIGAGRVADDGALGSLAEDPGVLISGDVVSFDPVLVL